MLAFLLLLGFPTVVGDPTLPNAPHVAGVPDGVPAIAGYPILLSVFRSVPGVPTDVGVSLVVGDLGVPGVYTVAGNPCCC